MDTDIQAIEQAREAVKAVKEKLAKLEVTTQALRDLALELRKGKVRR